MMAAALSIVCLDEKESRVDGVYGWDESSHKYAPVLDLDALLLPSL